MSWVRLDDRFYNNRKILSVSLPARWLYLSALCVANQHASDGHVDQAAQDCLMVAVGRAGNFDALARELVTALLWADLGDGTFGIHDYLEYQLSADEQRKERAASAERQKRYRDKRRLVTDGVTPLRDTEPTPSKTDPRPVPSRPDLSKKDGGIAPAHVSQGQCQHPPAVPPRTPAEPSPLDSKLGQNPTAQDEADRGPPADFAPEPPGKPVVERKDHGKAPVPKPPLAPAHNRGTDIFEPLPPPIADSIPATHEHAKVALLRFREHSKDVEGKPRVLIGAGPDRPPDAQTVELFRSALERHPTTEAELDAMARLLATRVQWGKKDTGPAGSLLFQKPGGMGNRMDYYAELLGVARTPPSKPLPKPSSEPESRPLNQAERIAAFKALPPEQLDRGQRNEIAQFEGRPIEQGLTLTPEIEAELKERLRKEKESGIEK